MNEKSPIDDVEPWRSIYLRLNSVLEWERKYDPMIIFTFVTLIFTWIPFLKLSVLTIVSSLIFLGVIIENVLPIVWIWIFRNEQITTSDELKLNRFYQRWTFVKETVIKQNQCLQSFRQEKPTEYFVLGVIFLLIFAIYGQMIDNSLLSYYSILVVLLIPGIHHQQLFSKIFQIIRCEFRRFFY